MKKVRFVRMIVVLTMAVLLLGMVYSLAGADQGSALHDIQKRGAIRVGWGVWFPYVFRDPKTNELAGVTVDLCEELGKALGVKVEWVEDNWATLIAGIQAGKFDITNLMAITLPRALNVGYTKPVTKHGLSILVKEKYKPQCKSWKDMDKADKRVGVTLGSNTDMFVTKQFQKAEIVRLPTVPDLIMALMADKIDAYASTIDSLTITQRDTKGLYLVPGEFGRSEVAFATRQDDQIFINWLNHFVREKQIDGTITRLLEKHGLDASYVVE